MTEVPPGLVKWLEQCPCVGRRAEHAERFRAGSDGDMDLASKHMCPHCGAIVPINKSGLTRSHSWPKPTRQVCPGSGQNPRNPLSDLRTLWNGKPNPHVSGERSEA